MPMGLGVSSIWLKISPTHEPTTTSSMRTTPALSGPTASISTADTPAWIGTTAPKP